MLCRKVAIHNKSPDELVTRIHCQLQGLRGQQITYGLYLVFQSTGRFIPGCGQAGQKMAIEPSGMDPSSFQWPSPCSIRFWRSLHCRDVLKSCLYRFYISVLECGYRKGMEAYRDSIRKHFACHHLQLRIILLSGGFTLKVISQKVIQHRVCEDCLNLLKGCRKEPRSEELSIFLTPIGTNAE